MKKNFNTVVIGGGVAGSSAAASLQNAGQKVAVIENEFFGGTCPNRGCDPKKILLGAIETKKLVEQLRETGIDGETQINWENLMKKKRAYTGPISANTQKWLQSTGVETYHSSGQFNDSGNFEVDGDELEADNFIIATGLRPSILPIKGNQYLETSNEFLDLDNMPERVAFIGAGYEAFEFASIARTAGAEVHIIHHNDKPLKAFDSDMVSELVKSLQAQGVQFDFNVDITEIEKSEDAFILTDRNGYSLSVDRVFGTTGRIPNVENIGLDKVNVDYDKRGIKVDDHLRTSNSTMFALGDVISRKSIPKLTPVATFDSNYVVAEILGKNTKAIDYPAIPSVIFGTPKLAKVGVDTAQAKESDDYKVTKLDVTSWFSYMRLNEPKAVVKVVLEKESHRIVGAECMSGEADQLINYFTFIIDDKITMDQIGKRVFAYPTIASDLGYFG